MNDNIFAKKLERDIGIVVNLEIIKNMINEDKFGELNNDAKKVWIRGIEDDIDKKTNNIGKKIIMRYKKLYKKA